MNVVLLVELGLEPEHLRAAAYPGHRRLDRLLHDLAELSGVLQFPLAGHHGRFDGQELAADFRPGEPRAR